MKQYSIAIVSDAGSWFAPFAEKLRRELVARGHEVRVLPHFDRAHAYEMVFLLSCSELIPAADLQRNRHNLVVHASALPAGKGWSPMTWQILEGRSHFPVTLFEAVAAVDAGPIYLQREMQFDGTELVDDLRRIMGNAIVALCTEFVDRYPAVLTEARDQSGVESFYSRRRPEDSRLDLDKTLREQMNLLRVVDNERYPAFFDWKGKRYRLAITRMGDAPVDVSIEGGHPHMGGRHGNSVAHVADNGAPVACLAVRQGDCAKQVAA